MLARHRGAGNRSSKDCAFRRALSCRYRPGPQCRDNVADRASIAAILYVGRLRRGAHASCRRNAAFTCRLAEPKVAGRTSKRSRLAEPKLAGRSQQAKAACRAEACRAEPASEGGLPSRSLPGGASKRRRLAEPKLAGRGQQAKAGGPGWCEFEPGHCRSSFALRATVDNVRVACQS
jgi:hypothetical protein